ncbi:MAG: protein kinase [Candidatus Eisenbacteria bacterium]|nr:protein kinase [Candidatus Eisenbacteria bacterium]
MTGPELSSEEILEQALALDPARRLAFLERACGKNRERFDDLASLLAIHDRFPELLQRPGDRVDPASPLPSTIGGYRVLREIGRGGMGVVVLAEDERLHRLVALKLLPDPLARDAAARARFEREAQLLAAMNHPNIATIYSLEQDEEQNLRFLAMEFLEGDSLAERLAGGPLPLARSLAIARQVARALEAAHEKGIVHRDLKPSNVIVGKDGRVKVLDFGLARSLRREVTDADESGTVMGTPGYMGPEQFSRSDVDPRTDIWSFGCLLFECLSGAPAFGGRTPSEAMRLTVSASPDWSRLPPSTPPRVRDLLRRCLEKGLDARLPNIRLARRELEEEMAERSILRRRPPPATVRGAASAGNVPHLLDRFVGRAREQREIGRLLRRCRLVTVTGPGGCGKTRLAQQVARARASTFRDGVWLADLSAAGDTEQAAARTASALRLRDRAMEHPLFDSLLEWIGPREMLLLLDGCERSGEVVRELLERCPRLKVLATALGPLGIRGEAVLRLGMLLDPELPDRSTDLAPLLASPSVQLFVDRWGHPLTSENASAVLEICRLAEGMPLALELAAAAAQLLPVADLAQRLTSRSPVPGWEGRTGWIDRAQSLLDPIDRETFQRLSVFRGGWSLDDAEAVCSGEGLAPWDLLDRIARLRDRSLIEPDDEGTRATGQARWRMLEAIRRFAAEQLPAAESQRLRILHRDHFVALSERLETELTGPAQRQAVSRLEAEYENLRAALDESLDPQAQASEIALRIAGSLGRFLLLQGRWTEGRTWIARALEAARTSPWDGHHPRLGRDATQAAPPASAFAKALHWEANLAERQGDLEAARRASEESLAIWRARGEEKNVARLLNNLANLASRQGNAERAERLYAEALAIHERGDDRLDMAHIWNNLGALHAGRGDFAKARSCFERSVDLKRMLGDRAGVAAGLQNLGALAGIQRDFEAARSFLREAMAVREETGSGEAVAVVSYLSLIHI